MRVFMICVGLAAIGVLWSPLWANCAMSPVFLSGDEDLRLSPLLRGSGTRDDPYLLSGLALGSSKSDYGIWIENTRSWIVVEGCSIQDVNGCDSPGAVVLSNCRNVTVRNCEVMLSRVGIALVRCTDIRIEDNSIHDNAWGVKLDFFSEGNVLIGNRLDNQTNAVAFAPNVWTEGGRGNCWSDLLQTLYEIGPGNDDFAPHSLAECPALPDTAPPRIGSIVPEPISVDVGSPRGVLSSGLYASDDRDGRVEIVCEGTDAALGTLGEYDVRCYACDSAGNCSQTTRRILVVDRAPPQIRLLGPDPLEVEVWSDLVALDPRVEALDAYEGTVVAVPDYSNVNQDVLGDYSVVYRACDSSGNCAQISRAVEVVDTQPPQLVLLGDAPLVLNVGDDVSQNDPGAKALDAVDGDLTDRVVTDYASVDSESPGIYSIVYEVTDSSGNAALPLRRAVVVGIGVAPQLPSDTPLLLGVDRWTVEDGRLILAMRVSSSDPIASYLSQLHAARVLRTIMCSLPAGVNLPLRFQILDTSGDVLAGELAPSSDSGCTSFESVLEVARKFDIRSPSGQELPTLSDPPRDVTEAHGRATAVFAFLTDFPAYTIRISASYEDDPAFSADISVYGMYPVDDGGGGAGPQYVAVREETRRIAQAIRDVLGPNVGVAVSQFVDVYGLIYRGSIPPRSPLLWVDVFVHSLLQGD